MKAKKTIRSPIAMILAVMTVFVSVLMHNQTVMAFEESNSDTKSHVEFADEHEFDVVDTNDVTNTYQVPEIEDAPLTSSSDITFSYEYVQSDVMPYILYTPSTAATNEKTPLIISLHGMGDIGTGADNFKNKFISKMLMNWELEGFNAYVLIPHLSNAGYADTWNSPYVAEKLFTIIDRVVEEYDIDPNQIVIQGQSMGGYGCLYMAAYHPEYFAAVVPISAYNSNADLAKLEGMPFRAYVGTPANGEDGHSVNFVMGTLRMTFGEENVNQRACSHDEIPIVAFTEDLNEDGKSDLIEWMLAQYKFS